MIVKRDNGKCNKTVADNVSGVCRARIKNPIKVNTDL